MDSLTVATETRPNEGTVSTGDSTSSEDSFAALLAAARTEGNITVAEPPTAAEPAEAALPIPIMASPAIPLVVFPLQPESELQNGTPSLAEPPAEQDAELATDSEAPGGGVGAWASHVMASFMATILPHRAPSEPTNLRSQAVSADQGEVLAESVGTVPLAGATEALAPTPTSLTLDTSEVLPTVPGVLPASQPAADQLLGPELDSSPLRRTDNQHQPALVDSAVSTSAPAGPAPLAGSNAPARNSMVPEVQLGPVGELLAPAPTRLEGITSGGPIRLDLLGMEPLRSSPVLEMSPSVHDLGNDVKSPVILTASPAAGLAEPIDGAALTPRVVIFSRESDLPRTIGPVDQAWMTSPDVPRPIRNAVGGELEVMPWLTPVSGEAMAAPLGPMGSLEPEPAFVEPAPLQPALAETITSMPVVTELTAPVVTEPTAALRPLAAEASVSEADGEIVRDTSEMVDLAPPALDEQTIGGATLTGGESQHQRDDRPRERTERTEARASIDSAASVNQLAAQARPLMPATSATREMSMWLHQPIVSQLSRGIEQAIERPGQAIHLRLHPEGLGAVTLEVGLNGSEVHLSIAVDNPGTRDLIQSNWSNLTRGLNEQGLSIAGAQVELAGGQAQGGNPEGQQQGWSPPRSGSMMTASAQDESPLVSASVSRSSASGVDYRV